MMRGVVLSGLAALAVGIVVAFAAGRSDPPLPPAPREAVKSDRVDIEDRLREAGRTKLIETIRVIPISPPVAPAPVPSPVVEQPPASPVATVAPDDEEPPRRRARERPGRRGDLCQRHGLRKVMVGRYRWRCR